MRKVLQSIVQNWRAEKVIGFGFGKKGMFRKKEIMCKKFMFWEIVRSLTIWDDSWIRRLERWIMESLIHLHG
jgi:hypothetical protein